VCIETSTVLRAVAADWSLEIPSDNSILHVPSCVHCHAQSFRLEVEPHPRVVFQVQIGLSIVLYMRSLFLVESCDLRPSSQYILVRVIPSCFHFAKMCLCSLSS
jgi:hypothetical protein